jgi:hypothetical protein
MPENASARDASLRIAVQKTITRATLLGLAGVLLSAGCHSSEGGPPVPLDDLARLLADALCSNIGPCCQEGGFAHDPVLCQAAAENEMRQEIEQRRSANIVYDGDAARACVDAYTAMAKACHDEGAIGNACRFVFVGALQPGQPCTDNIECAAGASCQRASDGGPARCTKSTLVHGKKGEGCWATCTEDDGGSSCGFGGSGNGGNATCYTNDGLYCDARTFACTQMPALDEPCTAGTSCAGEAFCDNGVCTAKRTSGSCGELNNGCAEGVYCEMASRQCMPLKTPGAACTASFECADNYRCADGACQKRTIASAASCRGNL